MRQVRGDIERDEGVPEAVGCRYRNPILGTRLSEARRRRTGLVPTDPSGIRLGRGCLRTPGAT